MKYHCTFQDKNLRSMALFYSFTNLFHVWHSRSQLDSSISFCFQSVARSHVVMQPLETLLNTPDNMRVRDTIMNQCYYENDSDFAAPLKSSQGPPGVLGLHFGNHCCKPVGLKHRQKRVLNLGCWSWWVSLPWEGGPSLGKKEGGSDTLLSLRE